MPDDRDVVLTGTTGADSGGLTLSTLDSSSH